MSLKTLVLCLSLLQILLRPHKASAKVTAIIVFGDSTVDAGNNNGLSTILKSNFEPYGRDFEGGRPTGRFSNGRIPTDFISEAFGLKPSVPAYLDPAYGIKDFATGVCFASAGTGYDNATSDVLSVIPLWKELDYFKDYQAKLKSYLGDQNATAVLSEALYVMSIGTNDFLENYYSIPGGRAAQFTVQQYQDFLVGISERFVVELYRLGARKLDLTGVPPMGCLPLERAMDFMAGSACNEEYNRVSREFNRKLEALVGKLNGRLKGMRIAYGNAYEIVSQVVQKPDSYGFENAGVACCATGVFEMGYMCNKMNPFTCTDANKYVFWDAFHPTEKMNQLVANYVMKNNLMVFM
ncbi:uncharacterized protein A4U43_C01F1550 [Asparagus officinalis]|uniref:GDSL esterase/lipase n=1 Tax=Asparagus officinalis TaxID=4686 RepID=A0A5P1FQI2_ASPOF|nr:GDSL esterase/lipase At4g26790-like [Asparagus officinalis]ONK78971.1 uncharacterized protein A4U43_C01F1550 [Asparagus officinalis]